MDSKKFRIRYAEEDDCPLIAEFNAAMALETEHLSLDFGRLLQGVRGLLAGPQFGFYLLAEKDGQIVGQIMVTYEWSDWRNGLFWWIQSVYVRPQNRRQGIFRRLLQEVERLAQSADQVCGLRLYVENDNRSAQETYLRLGFLTTAYRVLEKGYCTLPTGPNPLG